jgi:hypothetical protein
MADMDPDGAVGHLMTVLPEYGINNPDAHLANLGFIL